MAIDDIGSLRGQLPVVFLDQTLPSRWEEEWLFIPIEDPEGDSGPNANLIDYKSDPEEWFGDDGHESHGALPPTRIVDLPVLVPDIESKIVFGGAPQQAPWISPMPPPDAFAFYLPFHYFYPTWWGVYIILENALQLAEFVRAEACGELTRKESLAAVQIFLYAHEAFHHIVESFATRLEITHRIPVYRTGFNRYFGRTAGTDDSIEEALATAYAYRRVKSRFAVGMPNKREAALKALRSFIKQCPPGYSRAPEFFPAAAFDAERGAFAEGNHRESFPSAPGKNAEIWDCFPHAFSGISRVTSRVNYVVRRDSTLASRMNLNLRYLRYRELQEKLKTLASCEPLRQGHGSHEIWKTPDGKKFPIPRHPGDIHRGLLAGIIKQSGLQMSVTEFLAA